MDLNETERKVAARLLSLAGAVYRNRVCNDFDLEFLPVEERRKLIESYEAWNGTPEEFDPEHDYKGFVDFALMSYLGERLDPSLETERIHLPRRRSSRTEIDNIIDVLSQWAGGSQRLSMNELQHLIEQLTLYWQRVKTD